MITWRYESELYGALLEAKLGATSKNNDFTAYRKHGEGKLKLDNKPGKLACIVLGVDEATQCARGDPEKWVFAPWVSFMKAWEDAIREDAQNSGAHNPTGESNRLFSRARRTVWEEVIDVTW
jgi:hypothetical protein